MAFDCVIEVPCGIAESQMCFHAALLNLKCVFPCGINDIIEVPCDINDIIEVPCGIEEH